MIQDGTLLRNGSAFFPIQSSFLSSSATAGGQPPLEPKECAILITKIFSEFTELKVAQRQMANGSVTFPEAASQEIIQSTKKRLLDLLKRYDRCPPPEGVVDTELRTLVAAIEKHLDLSIQNHTSFNVDEWRFRLSSFLSQAKLRSHLGNPLKQGISAFLGAMLAALELMGIKPSIPHPQN